MMSPPREITVGIPTFNRSEAVRRTLEGLAESLGSVEGHRRSPIRVLVSDNASLDDTLEVLLGMQRKFDAHEHLGVELKILANDVNVGFQGNILRLLDACSTRYLMLWSDEDDLSVSAVDALESQLARYPSAFASPQFFIDGRRYRGERRNRRIREWESQSAAFYLSGLVIAVQDFQDNRELFVNGGCFSDETLYPQVEVLQGLMALGYPTRWLPVKVGGKREQLPTEIAMSDGSEYFRLAGRVEQAKRSEAWLAVLSTKAQSGASRKVIQRLLDHQPYQVIATVLHALEGEGSAALRATSRLLRRATRLYPPRMAWHIRREAIRWGPSVVTQFLR